MRDRGETSSGGTNGSRLLVRSLAINRSYLLVASVLWIGMVVQILQLQFSTDFWIHTPAVAEFMEHPLEPSHIYVAAEVPHHALNAYHWGIAVLGNALGLSAISAAQVAGVVNVTALLLFFPQFVRTFIDRESAPLVALLVFTLAWGPGAWRFAGFMNLNSLGFGITYPAYFALWITFLVIWYLRLHLSGEGPGSWRGWAMLALGGFLVSHTHLITFGGLLVFAVGLVGSRTTRRGVLALAAIVAGAVVGAVAWPFFNLFEVVFRFGPLDAENYAMYERVIVRSAPALLGVYPLWRRFRADPRDPLVIAFLASALLYLSGALIGRETMGRMLNFGLMSLHLALVGWISDLAERATPDRSLRFGRSIIVGALVALGLALSAPAVVRMIPSALLPAQVAGDERLETDFGWVIPAGDLLDYGDVVLALPSTSTQLASVGAKLVTFRTVPYIEDQEGRTDDVVEFFIEPDPATLDQYQVDWIAFRENELSEPQAERIEDLGRVYRLPGLTLIEVDP
jgi:hypothetical protein